ncbi:Tyrosine-protein phosphatase non-receptor type 14 [Eumeta japonica]|uniref:Tyrosine-protein phosphatase non-receptor type 14 n=1 Tax=Eumeta variegata TaxID=151549 RepID=A0A4C1Z906_EUMVA|nr:Tyrosine-protein phosphatase non-receptor type 14 [Eumeta japonica]
MRPEHGLSESREELERSGVELRTPGSEAALAPSHRAYSASCLELNVEPPQVHRLRALLPSYRPAPDYETAIQQKYQQQRMEAQAVRYQNHHAQIITTNVKPLVYGSHPDIHRIHYPDVTRHTVSMNQGVANTDDYGHSYGLKFLGHNNYTPFAVNPNVQTEMNPQLHYINLYKPPPPYPANGLASNSTPDLALASQISNYHRGYINVHVSGSSPDLVSTRTRQYLEYMNGGNAHNVANYTNQNLMPTTHGTYNNLTTVVDMPAPHIIIDPLHGSDSIQKAFDERSAIIYGRPGQRRIVVPTRHTPKEPIYENVPLPWQSGRERAHSLSATDEVSRLNDRNIRSASHTADYLDHRLDPTKLDSNLPLILYKVNRKLRTDLEGLKLSGSKEERIDVVDETPYQSLSTHRAQRSTDSAEGSTDNVISICVTGPPEVQSGPHVPMLRRSHDISHSSGIDNISTNTSILNSTYNTTVDLESSANTTKSSIVSSKEKKRRRWGMFMGRAPKAEVKSATLGRDRSKPTATSAMPPNRHRWSTGLPKFQPLPPSITKENMCQLLERKMSEEQLSFAFEQIPKGREGGEAALSTALLPEHAAANGFSSEQLPYEDNRVRLHPSPHNRHGYINASHITMTVGSSQRFYVLARVPHGQAPRLSHVGANAGGVADAAERLAALLWECVWLVGARIIAYIGGDERPSYLPDINNTVDYDKFQVHMETWQRAAWGATSRVRVRRTGERRPRLVWHVQYSLWPDALRVPEDPNTFFSYEIKIYGHLAFLSEVSGLRLACAAGVGGEMGPLHGDNAPLAVAAACSSRAGLALAADLLLHTLDHNQVLIIPLLRDTLPQSLFQVESFKSFVIGQCWLRTTNELLTNEHHQCDEDI